MRTTKKLALAAALLASAAFGPATVLASQDDNDRDRGRQEDSNRPDRPDRPDRGDQGNQPDMGDRGRGGNDNDNNRSGNDRGNDRGDHNMNRGAGKGPPANFRGQRPERTFRGAPPNFHGATSPRAGMSAGANARGSFRGHTSYDQFSSSDRAAWRHGSWRHTRHNGKWGWWWYVGGVWFFYDAPIYPFPTFIGYYYDEYPYDYYWYWCDDPPGYYPYVRECYYDWVPVPPYY